MNEFVLVKLGGSVITKKDVIPPAINIPEVIRIAKEIQASTKPLVIVLGGGAYGHQAAHKYGFGIADTPASRLLSGIPSIRHNMSLLSGGIETILQSEGVSSVVIPPFPIVTLIDGEIERFPLEVITKTLNSGHTVITHGDVCYDSTRGASILSGDTIVAYLANQLNTSSVFVGTNVDGVLDANPNENPNAQIIPTISEHNKEQVIRVAGPSSSTDVTGGMAKKIHDLFLISQKGIEVAIFNLSVPGRLEGLLKGDQVICTRILA
ncbi:MAG: isopentenyl phosphate kinase [Candidatus Thorarchaeota archaeon]|nr:isopentenyl phosphate kinase [Candidatus Thorarchaeota archaeon]